MLLPRVNKGLNPHLNIDIHEVTIFSTTNHDDHDNDDIDDDDDGGGGGGGGGGDDNNDHHEKVAVSDKAGTVLYKTGTIHAKRK